MSSAVAVGDEKTFDEAVTRSGHMSSAEPNRRNRLPEFTKRDGQALAWLGEQYGARLDVLGVLLGRLGGGGVLTRSGVRNQIERWQRQGLVTTRRMLGETWVTPSRLGLERVELSYPVWGMPVTRLRHCHAVNVVRLWWELQAQSQLSPWISERRCYAERGKGPTWHIPDGKVVDPRSIERDGPAQFLAIEVELTHKGRKAYDQEVFGNLQAGTIGVRYFVSDDAFAKRLRSDITAVLERRGAGTRFEIGLLPEVPGVTYRGNW